MMKNRISNWLFLAAGLALILFGAVRTVAELSQSSNQTGDGTPVAGGLANFVDLELYAAQPAPTLKPAPYVKRAVLPREDLEDAGLLKPRRLPGIPTRIVIPSIGLDAPVVQARSYRVNQDGVLYGQYMAPSRFAAGWHPNSARLGQLGNTVINGHHNFLGKVFEHLVDVAPGDKIIVYAGERAFHYVVTNRMVLMEKDAPLAVRVTNARWLARSTDERLTLITCWPATSNTHRLVIVAAPEK